MTRSLRLFLIVTTLFIQGCATNKLLNEAEGYTGPLELKPLDLNMPKPKFEWRANLRSAPPRKLVFTIEPQIKGCEEIILYGIRQGQVSNKLATIVDGYGPVLSGLSQVKLRDFEEFKELTSECAVLSGTVDVNKNLRSRGLIFKRDDGPKTTSYSELVFYTKDGEFHREKTPDLSKPYLNALLIFSVPFDIVTFPIQFIFLGLGSTMHSH
ncbi:MAG: hypothetical protein H7A01_03245 [Hahellaceae bacterium]|nr:hypothetical protein [Hahellaceae bacterium]MCP5212340.1 hypothetical protein [Hahellaceae bacterium]